MKQLLSVSEHSHDPDPNKVKVVRVKNTIKTVDVTNRVRPAFFLLILMVTRGSKVKKKSRKNITEGVLSYFALSSRGLYLRDFVCRVLSTGVFVCWGFCPTLLIPVDPSKTCLHPHQGLHTCPLMTHPYTIIYVLSIVCILKSV